MTAVKNLLLVAACCATLAMPAHSQKPEPKAKPAPKAKSAAVKPAAVEPVPGKAAPLYARNGDFETVAAGRPADWKVSGDVRLQAKSGAWRKLAAKFRSDKEKKVYFYFWVPRGASGSVWIDNIEVSGGLDFQNGSFESAAGTAGEIPGWEQYKTGSTVFLDSSRASQGKSSLRVTHAHEAVPETIVYQAFAVQPGQEYTLSFDIYVGDDFQGEAKGWLFNEARSTSLDFEYKNLIGSNLVAERDRLGKFALAMNPAPERPASIEQEMLVTPGANLQGSFDLQNRGFKGTVRFTAEDAVSGKVLHQQQVTYSTEPWRSENFSFQSVSAKLRVRFAAEGEGALQLDNVVLGPPQVVPPLQQAKWLPSAQNFFIPNTISVQVDGAAGAVIDGGLALLSKDLKALGIETERNQAGSPVRILVGAAHKVAGKGDEAYTLSVDSKSVVIKAGSESGAFYGLMTLLQLIEKRDGRPVFLPCKVTDYPDMPLRGFLYGDEEQAARWKMNAIMLGTGYPVTAEQRKALRAQVKQCQSLNLQVIPSFMTVTGGYYVQQINPNLAAGIWVQDEQITLRGETPSPLANRYVIRTGLSDIALKSADGKTVYQAGRDYRVVDGEINFDYRNPTAAPFSVARLPGSAIPDGAMVLASYDYVSHRRQREDPHIAFVPLEPEARKLTDDFLTELAREYPFTLVNTNADLHEFFIQDAQLETDSRVVKSGKKPIELLAEEVNHEAAALKRGNPGARIFQWTGDVGDYAKAASQLLPKDAHINVWGYDATWPAAYGREALTYWHELGFETSVMPWDNLHNVRQWAQVVREARAKGFDCKGMIGSAWDKRDGGFRETAAVAWKIPKIGDKNYVPLPK